MLQAQPNGVEAQAELTGTSLALTFNPLNVSACTKIAALTVQIMLMPSLSQNRSCSMQPTPPARREATARMRAPCPWTQPTSISRAPRSRIAGAEPAAGDTCSRLS